MSVRTPASYASASGQAATPAHPAEPARDNTAGELEQPVYEAPNGVLRTMPVPAEAIVVVEKADAVHWVGWSGG
jgi:hypothetical protein